MCHMSLSLHHGRWINSDVQLCGCAKNMSVVLEPVVAEAEEPVEVGTTPDTVDDTPPPESVVEATAPQPVEQAAAEPTTPAPKRPRGRPRKDPDTPAKAVAPKAGAKAVAKRAATAPVPAPPSSSDEEEPMSQADLETEILHYLVQMKSQQQDRRRQLWSQLAGLGLIL